MLSAHVGKEEWPDISDLRSALKTRERRVIQVQGKQGKGNKIEEESNKIENRTIEKNQQN